MTQGDLDVRIDGVPVTRHQIEAWEARRAKAVLKRLRRMLHLPAPAEPNPDDLPRLRAQLLQIKTQCGRDGLRQVLRGSLRLSAVATRLGLVCSGAGRKPCVVEIRVPGCTASQVAEGIDALMRQDTEANRQSNLLACPDHYVLEPRGDTLEVIETTGGSPFPARFFLRFDDASGVMTPRDPAYTHQSMGTARLGDGTVIGGVRHQFRDVEGGTLARLLVEFPRATPNGMVREHQWHLACEFSHWLRHARALATRATGSRH